MARLEGMPTIVKAAGAADLLALVPEVAGFVPRDSLVLVAFRGTRTCGALRFDLPRSSSPASAAAAATAMTGMLARLPDVDAVVPVCYTDDAFGPYIPHGAIMDAVIERAEHAGFEVRDALCVAADGWGSYFDPDCPPGGRDLADISSSTAAGEVRGHGSRVLGDQRAVPPPIDVDLATRERIARLTTRMLAVDADPEFAEWRIDLPEFIEGVLDALGEGGWPDIPDWVAAALIAMAQAPADRDVILFQAAFDLDVGRMTQDYNWSWSATGHAPQNGIESRRIDGILLGQGVRPSPERVEAAIDLMSGLVGRAPRSLRAPLLTMLAWLHWALGRSSVAGDYLEEALAVDERYGLAELLTTMLERGMLPDWAFLPASE